MMCYVYGYFVSVITGFELAQLIDFLREVRVKSKGLMVEERESSKNNWTQLNIYTD